MFGVGMRRKQFGIAEAQLADEAHEDRFLLALQVHLRLLGLVVGVLNGGRSARRRVGRLRR